jgi:hypothetical protein
MRSVERGVEAGLLEEEASVGRGEDVVVVADPDVVVGQGGAGDLVGADRGGAAGGLERVEVARLAVEQVETRESGAVPAFGGVADERARVGQAVVEGVDAVLGLRADLPDREA